MLIGVVGAGSWGTTVANLLVQNGHQVKIWAREVEVVESINADHVNGVFLANCELDHRLVAVGEIGQAVKGVDLIVSAAPSHATRKVFELVQAEVGDERPVIVSISKGLEPETHYTMTHVISEMIPGAPVVALSGPSFAKEVFEQRPTAIVAASDDQNASGLVQQACSNGYFRVYTSSDPLGVQLGGALKNVVAIAAGILDGLDLGTNPRAALLTRGLAETTRLGEVLGADPHTFAGLAGMGDMLLTATGPLSRNRTLGIELAQGKTLDQIMNERRTVAEGVNTAKVANDLAIETGVELPIANEVEKILFENKSPKQAIRDLMERELKAERWW
ncbi:MAG: NAD(P)-dependent glycerol-3-phosphate dehydrogenase [Gemmatimonadota bacterium]|nr:NAD(P)-dependent glycerol-3-phosphate dehydrogenase [Gemmatimonadota bacterium]